MTRPRGWPFTRGVLRMRDILERCVAACDAKAAHRDAGATGLRPTSGLPAVVDYAWGIELTWLRRDPRAIACLLVPARSFAASQIAAVSR